MAVNPNIPTGASSPAKDAEIAKNFQEIANREVTDVKNDQDGTPHILLGYQEDGFGTGQNHGFKVSQQGVDVRTATDDQLVMSSAFNMLRIVETGSATVNVPVSYTTGSVHTADVSPTNDDEGALVLAWVTLPGSSTLWPTPWFNYAWNGTDLEYRVKTNAEFTGWNNNDLRFRVRPGVTGTSAYEGDWTFYYYILSETIT